MDIDMRVISPDVAAAMLERNIETNRGVRSTYVHQLAHEMKQGRFVSGNGQTIVVTKDGTLIDGQHRLHAIIESGQTYEFPIVTVDNERAFKTIDVGTPRRVGDYFRSYPNSNAVATVGKIMYCAEHGSMGVLGCMQGRLDSNTTASKPAVIEYIDANLEAMVDLASAARGLYRALGRGSNITFGAFVGIVRLVGKGAAMDSFIREFENMASTNAVISLLKATIVQRDIKNRNDLARVLFEAYEKYSQGYAVKRLGKGDHYIKQYDERLDEWRRFRKEGLAWATS